MLKWLPCSEAEKAPAGAQDAAPSHPLGPVADGEQSLRQNHFRHSLIAAISTAHLAVSVFIAIKKMCS